MQRRAKINKIKDLLDEIQEKKEVHFCNKHFYSDMEYMYEDREHTIKISKEEVDAYCERERIKYNADRVIYISVCSRKD
jgi:hypothetical protein